MQQQSIVVVVPPAPLCSRCGHTLCPCCTDWCDMLTDEFEACCDGRCQINRYERMAWEMSYANTVRAALEQQQPGIEISIVAAVGPWLPFERRIRIELALDPPQAS